MNKIKQHTMDNIKYDCPPSSIKAKIGTRIKRGSFLFEKQRSGGWKVVQGRKLRSWLKYWYVDKQLPMRQVSEQTGIAHSTLQKLLLDMDIMRSKKVSWEERSGIVEKYAAELSNLNKKDFRNEKYLAYWLSKKSGVSFTSMQLSKAADRCNLKIEDTADLYTQFLDKNQDLILSIYDSGCTLIDLHRRILACAPSKRFSLSITRLRTYLKDKDKYEPGRRKAKRLKNLNRYSMQPIEKHYTGAFGDNPTRVQFSLGVDLKRLTYSEYKRLISYLTTYLKSEIPSQYSKFKNTKNSGLHLDHKFSKMMGFYVMDHTIGDYVPREDPVPLHIMCHPNNLELITSRANLMKGSACTIEYKELCESVKKSKFQLIRAAKEL